MIHYHKSQLITNAREKRNLIDVLIEVIVGIIISKLCYQSLSHQF